MFVKVGGWVYLVCCRNSLKVWDISKRSNGESLMHKSVVNEHVRHAKERDTKTLQERSYHQFSTMELLQAKFSFMYANETLFTQRVS